MKVLVLGVRGIPNVQGGVETHAEQLYPRLARLGCAVEVIVRSPFVPRGLSLFRAVRLRRIWSPRTSGVEAFVHSVLGVLYAGIARPDVLHIHAVGPAIVTPLARLLGLCVVVTHHGADYQRDKWGPVARHVLRLGERVGMQYSAARIAISGAIARLIRADYDRDSHLIPNGVATAHVAEGTATIARLGLEPGRYFLQVSRLVPEKRQLDAIAAWSALQPCPWRLALVGAIADDAYSRSVVAAADAAGVVVTGVQQGEALAELYANAGAFVLPSSHEGLPIAMLEALSYGLPVVASDIPANVEVGLPAASYFPVGDVAALTASLRAAMFAPHDEAARAARREFVSREYDWDRIAAQTLAVYEHAVRH